MYVKIVHDARMISNHAILTTVNTCDLQTVENTNMRVIAKNAKIKLAVVSLPVGPVGLI